MTIEERGAITGALVTIGAVAAMLLGRLLGVA